MAIISSNEYLSRDQMVGNAEYILNYFLSRGWTKNAVCGMLGNIQTESTMNPGLWESRIVNPSCTRCGFGLVQWTPASKYLSWADANGYAAGDIVGQCERIIYEVENGLQWIQTSTYPMTFVQFTKSTRSPEYLAAVFIRNYERPANPNQPIRGTQARYWFDTLTGEGSPNGGYQLAQFIMDMIHITQGENGSYSHMGTRCIDFVGTHAKYPYYAPCDCTCVRRIDSSAVMIWRSDRKVMCADGIIRHITWSAIHECNIIHKEGTKLQKGDLMGYTGVCGRVTGDHLHLQVIEGNKYNGFTRNSQGANTLIGKELHIYDVFAVNGVNIVNGYGYNWRTSDYVDGSEGGGGTSVTPGADNKQTSLIHMLLADAVNGWKF